MHKTQPLNRRKRILFFLIISLFSVIMSLLLAEMILRMTIGLWISSPQNIKLEPAGQFFIKKHNTLGYTNKPGEFKVTLPSGCSFSATNLFNGTRITNPLNTYPAMTRKKIWIFGCSFTYGW